MLNRDTSKKAKISFGLCESQANHHSSIANTVKRDNYRRVNPSSAQQSSLSPSCRLVTADINPNFRQLLITLPLVPTAARKICPETIEGGFVFETISQAHILPKFPFHLCSFANFVRTSILTESSRLITPSSICTSTVLLPSEFGPRHT